MAKLYLLSNTTATSTAAPVKQPTGTAIRTMLQIKTGVGQPARVVEWGCSFDGSAAATPGQVELFGCTGAATMSTALVNADIMPYNDPNAFVNASNVPFDLSTTTSGFATAAVTEGTVANYRGFEAVMLPPTGPYSKQFPLGREPEIGSASFMRIRVTFGTTVNMYCYVILEV